MTTDKKPEPNAVACLAKAQGQLKNIEKGTDNPFFKSKYASLDDVLDVVRPVLAKNDLALFQGIVHHDNNAYLQTRILHIDGTVFQDDGVPLKMETKGGTEMQRLGSCVSYARRYGCMAALNITSCDAGEDNDGSDETQDNWAGPLPKTQLTEAGRRLASEINQSESLDELKEVQLAGLPVIEQLQHDLPKWYYGDPDSQNGEVLGVKGAIDRRRGELEKEAETIDDIVPPSGE